MSHPHTKVLSASLFDLLYSRNPRRREEYGAGAYNVESLHEIFSCKQIFFSHGNHAQFCQQNAGPTTFKQNV